jgi:hypothetical protein
MTFEKKSPSKRLRSRLKFATKAKQLFFCDSNKIIDKTITFPDFSKVFRKKHSKLSFFTSGRRLRVVVDAGQPKRHVLAG